jgi:uncharacterized phiE125 gp8 family phage protein
MMLCTPEDVFNYMRKPVPAVDDPEYRLVEDLIKRATDEIEKIIGGPVINQEVTERHNTPGWPRLVLNHRPVVSLTSITDNGKDRTDEVVVLNNKGILLLKRGRFSRTSYGVEVTYITGYGSDVESIPQDIRHACVLFVQYWFKRDSLDYSQTYGESDILVNGPRFPVTALKMISKYKDVVV